MDTNTVMKEGLRASVGRANQRRRKLQRLLAQPAYWPALRRGVAASVEQHDVAFGCDFAMIFDVGASRGQFATFALHRFPAARIVAFEPLAAAREVLKTVLPADRSEIYGTALGASVGSAELHIAARDDSSSLLPIGRQQTSAFPGTHEISTSSVPLGVLRDFIDPKTARPTLLKIDVQGFELNVLRGADDRLELIDEIFVECSFVELYTGQSLIDDIWALLSERDFRLVGVYNVARDPAGRCLQADFLFRRRSG